MPDLAMFPVDEVTLNLLEHSLDAAFRVDADGHHTLVGAEFTLSQLLDFLSGYDPKQVVPVLDEFDQPVPDLFEYVGGSVYSERCVIRSLIAEIRRLRA